MSNKKKSEIIVDAIIIDLSDRRGLRHEWEQIDEDIQKEIRDKWINLIETVYPEVML